MGLLSCLVKLTLWSVILSVGFVAFVVFLPLIDMEPKSYRLKSPPDFTGPLADNDLLSQAEHLFENEITGPESVIQHKGAIYTGLSDGRIIKVRGDEFVTVANIGGDCKVDGVWDQAKCGRALGLRFDKKGDLYSIDAHFGIKKIDVKTGKVTSVFNTKETSINGRKSKFFDDMVIDEGAGKNGGHVFYISDASSKWDSDFHVGITGEHESTGRIVRFDADANEATAIVEGVGFPNGVELTDDKQAIIYSELNMRRLMIHYIRGPKKGSTEILHDNLPGEPDNVRRSTSQRETYWVALFNGRNGSHPHFFLDKLQEKPLTRKAIARFVHNLGYGIFWLGETFNYTPLKEVGFGLKSGFYFARFILERGLVLEIARDGQIVRALHSPDKATTGLSEVREVIENGEKVLYLGSYYNYYLGRLVLPN